MKGVFFVELLDMAEEELGESKVDKMIALMNQHEIPVANECCKNCAYSEQYANVTRG